MSEIFILLKGTLLDFFWCKINTKIDCLCSQFPVWNTVAQFKNYGTVYIVSIISIKVCSDTDLAYPSPMNKVVRISPYACIQYSASQPPPPPLWRTQKTYMYATYMYYAHVYNRNILIYFFHLDHFQCHTWNRYLKNSTRYMYPIRASQSTCFVASDISRGTFGVVCTINLRWLIVMDFSGFFSTNNFHAVKKFILSTAKPQKKLSRDDVIATRHAKIPHDFISP